MIWVVFLLNVLDAGLTIFALGAVDGASEANWLMAAFIAWSPTLYTVVKIVLPVAACTVLLWMDERDQGYPQLRTRRFCMILTPLLSLAVVWNFFGIVFS
jgi:hypothetical protein